MKLKSLQSISLFLLRVFIGWHLLYEGLVKVFDPDWTSAGYLMGSQGIFASLFKSIAENAATLQISDFVNQWALILIGLSLIIGVFTRVSAISGMMLLMLYYLCTPPWIGLEYAVPVEGNYMIVNKTLIEAAALFMLAMFPSGEQYGLDFILRKKNSTTNTQSED